MAEHGAIGSLLFAARYHDLDAQGATATHPSHRPEIHMTAKVERSCAGETARSQRNHLKRHLQRRRSDATRCAERDLDHSANTSVRRRFGKSRVAHYADANPLRVLTQ